MTPLPTTEERTWAVLSHLSAVAFGIGIFLPILGWSEQRRTSKYASFQCLQALGYQSLGYTIWLLIYLLIVLAAMILMFRTSIQAEASGQVLDPLEGPVLTLIVLSSVGFLALYAILPISAAVACALGRDFRYPVLGRRLAAYLAYESSSWNEENEERWVAAMGHFSVIIALWGLLAPLTTWILQGRQSAFLKFQSIQTVVYQLFVNLLYAASGVFYLAGTLIVFAVLGLEGNPNLGAPTGMAGLLMVFGSFLVAALILLAVPLLHILGQWAGYRILKGEEYRYPLASGLADRWIEKPQA